MSDRSTIFEGIQLGVEGTPGTLVDADKFLQALTLQLGPKTKIDLYRPTGVKFPTVASLAKEWTEASLGGPMTYIDIVYLLSGSIGSVSPEGAGTVKTWTFSPDSVGPDTVVTFSVEQGSSLRAHRFSYGLITGLTRNFSRDECTVTGTMIGQEIEDDVTLTANPTALPVQPIMPTQVLVYLASTQAGLASATSLSRAFSVTAALTNRFGPIWALNGDISFAAHAELEPQAQYTLLMEADDEGMSNLPTMRAGDTIWMKIAATGPIVDGSTHYSYTETAALKISNVSEFRDEQGVYSNEWTMNAVHDATWGKAFQIVVVNALADL
jgi:hypothetical protein